jgi:hypothetical protein
VKNRQGTLVQGLRLSQLPQPFAARLYRSRLACGEGFTRILYAESAHEQGQNGRSSADVARRTPEKITAFLQQPALERLQEAGLATW